jgi:hypothetical protein
MKPTWEDLQVWCEELNAWIISIGAEEEFKVAHPKGPFPLHPDPLKDDLEDDRDVIGYLTIWMMCKSGKRPPTGLHNRMILSDPFKGPWQELYSKIVRQIEANQEIDLNQLFTLAG